MDDIAIDSPEMETAYKILENLPDFHSFINELAGHSGYIPGQTLIKFKERMKLIIAKQMVSEMGRRRLGMVEAEEKEAWDKFSITVMKKQLNQFYNTVREGIMNRRIHNQKNTLLSDKERKAREDAYSELVLWIDTIHEQIYIERGLNEMGLYIERNHHYCNSCDIDDAYDRHEDMIEITGGDHEIYICKKCVIKMAKLFKLNISNNGD